MPKVIKRPSLKEAARLKFVGAKMANALLQALQSPTCMTNTFTRARVEKMVEQWDSICDLQLNNPITLANMEKAAFPNG
jgi:hypothetical protein